RRHTRFSRDWSSDVCSSDLARGIKAFPVRLVRLVPLLLVALLLTAAPAGASERVHIVQKGQRLGSIAKRYNVSIEALCAENGIKIGRASCRAGGHVKADVAV